MKRACFAWLSLLAGARVWADPLDAMEGYAERGTPPVIPGAESVALWVLDYALFALVVVALGWMFVRRGGAWARMEAKAQAWLAAIRGCCGRVAAWVAGLLAVAGWIFFCQWLDAHPAANGKPPD